MLKNVKIPKLISMFEVALHSLTLGKPWQPFFVVGSPGLGKTHIFRHILREMYAKHLGVTLEEVGIVEWTCSEKDPTSSAGYDVPVTDRDGRLVTRNSLSPLIDKIEQTGLKYGIVTLEELGNTLQDMQKIMSPLLDANTKTIGEDHLPKGWEVVNANGNRAQDQSGAIATLAHLCDRVRFVNLVFCINAFIQWCVSNSINVFIQEVAKAFWDKGLFADAVPSSREPEQFSTPRSLVNMSYDLDAFMDMDAFDGSFPEYMKDMFASNIGDTATAIIVKFMAQRDQVPSTEQIFANPESCLLSDQQAWQRISGDMAIAAMTDDRTADRALQYICRMRTEVKVVLAMKLLRVVNRNGMHLYGSDSLQKLQIEYPELLELSYQ